MLQRLLLGLVLLHCQVTVLAVSPGDGYYYSGNGGYENKCGISTCDSSIPPTVCDVGFYLSGCSGNSSGTCTPCNNKPGNASYTTRGNLVSDCAWMCNTGFTNISSACVSNTQCNTAKPGNTTYSDTNFPTCGFQCNAGFYNTQTSANPTSCTACDAGTYSSQGSTVCTNCSAGTYSTVMASPSSENCQNCPAGKFSTTVKAITSAFCGSCQAGTYTSSLGSTGCTACDAGTASANLGATDPGTCVQCTAGKFSNTTGSTLCTDCAAGTFMNVTGATKCYNCSPNTYAATAGLSVCAQCQICSSNGQWKSGCGPVLPGTCELCTNPAVSARR